MIDAPLPPNWTIDLNFCQLSTCQMFRKTYESMSTIDLIRFTSRDYCYFFYASGLISFRTVVFYPKKSNLTKTDIVYFSGKPSLSFKGLFMLYNLQRIGEERFSRYLREQLVCFMYKNRRPYKHTMFLEVFPEITT